ncbi:hypothetical protein [Sorangium sp. So ce887]|uniref:hypothetical protein n=1 Tax=Sorangium sp. So ce887 TaxID=3133324 RepID=UPI003F614339
MRRRPRPGASTDGAAESGPSGPRWATLEPSPLGVSAPSSPVSAKPKLPGGRSSS